MRDRQAEPSKNVWPHTQMQVYCQGEEHHIANFIWGLKEEGKAFEVTWEKMFECALYRRETRRCQLCEKEKMEILAEMQRSKFCLNRRTELLLPCIHKRKEMLAWEDVWDPG